MLRAFCACLGLALVLTLAIPADSGAQTQRQRRQQQQQQQQPQPEPPPAPQPAPPPEPAPPPPPPPPAVERRATEQSPVPVRVIEPAKSEAQLAAERKDRDDRATLGNRMLILTGLVAAVGFLLFIAFMVQALYLWLALRAMRRSAVLAGRNMTIAQRAFVHVRALDWGIDGTNVRIWPTWENSGATPTRSLRISTNWKASHGELDADFGYGYVRPPERLFLGPKARADVGAVLIPMRDIQAAIEQRVHLYVWGRASYEDVFDGTKPHSVEFCHRVNVSGKVPNDLVISFELYGMLNRTDEDGTAGA